MYSTSGDTLYATETPGNCTSTTTARDLGTASAAGVIIVAWDIIRKWSFILQSGKVKCTTIFSLYHVFLLCLSSLVYTMLLVSLDCHF